jgi:hypothetical protein
MNGPPYHEVPSGFITSLLILLWLLGSVFPMLIDLLFIPIFRSARKMRGLVMLAIASRDLLSIGLLLSFMAQLLKNFDHGDPLWPPMELWFVIVTCQVTTLADAVAQWKLRQEDDVDSIPIGLRQLLWLGPVCTVPLLILLINVPELHLPALYGWFQAVLHWLWGIPWVGLIVLGFGDFLGLRDLYSELKFIVTCAYGRITRTPVEEWPC